MAPASGFFKVVLALVIWICVCGVWLVGRQQQLPSASTSSGEGHHHHHHAAFSPSSQSSPPAEQVSSQRPLHHLRSHARTSRSKNVAAPADLLADTDKRGHSERKERPAIVINGENKLHQTDIMYRTTKWKEYNEAFGHRILKSNNYQMFNNEYDLAENYDDDKDDGNAYKYDENYNDDDDGSEHVEPTSSAKSDEQQQIPKSTYEGEESREKDTKYSDIIKGDTTCYNYDGFTGEQLSSVHFNVTPDAALLIYNRVPKCASSTIQTILRRLSHKLGFRHESSEVYDQRQLNKEEQLEFVYNLTSLANMSSQHFSYDRHLYYTNFTMFGEARPVYVNFIRDPVERFISSYYYVRSEERINRLRSKSHRHISPSLNWLKRSVGQCVLKKLPECSFRRGEDKETMVTYFCGHHHFCRMVGSQDALQEAKRVVSEEYSVVGLLEHMDLSLTLMETLVPHYFTGALYIYRRMKMVDNKININQKKPQVPLATKKKLMHSFANDMDLYNFVEQRLFLQRKKFLLH